MTDPTTDTSKKKSPTKQELEAFVRKVAQTDGPLQVEALKLLAGVG